MSFGAWPMTPAVKRFLIANGVVWLVLVISVNWMDALALHDHLALTPERVYPGLELWQPFTYMWLHYTGDFRDSRLGHSEKFNISIKFQVA